MFVSVSKPHAERNTLCFVSIKFVQACTHKIGRMYVSCEGACVCWLIIVCDSQGLRVLTQHTFNLWLVCTVCY